MADTQPQQDKKCRCVCPARIVIAVLASFGFAFLYGLRVNLNVIILSMINNTAVKKERHHAIIHQYPVSMWASENVAFTEQVRIDGPFPWNDKIRGVVLSSYFWGYIILQLPGGRLAELFSSKWVFLVAIGCNAIGCLLIPLGAYMHWGVLVALRIFQGCSGGMLFPCANVLLSRWAPPNERATMSTVIFSGTGIGTVIFMFGSGYIVSYMGWEAAFYIEGVIALIWVALWFFIAADNPTKMRYFITEQEKEYIMGAIAAKGGGAKPKMKVPWMSIATSMPFWAILSVNVLFLFGWYCFLVELPDYMNRVLKLPMRDASTAAAMPYLAMWLFSIALGRTLDHLQSIGKITCTTARKIATGICCIGPAICTGLITFVDSVPFVIFLAVVTISCGGGGMFAGFLSNPIDIAPNLAGTLLGITNSLGTIGGIVAPLAVGALLDADDSIRSWRLVFMALVVFYGIAAVIYLIFASGEVQPWNNPEETE